MAEPGPPAPFGAAPEAEADALARDGADPLSRYREQFLLPSAPDGAPAIYLAGQSLGLQPRSARAAIEAALDARARLGVDAWFTPDRPWFTLDDSLREAMARIVGARPSEVAILNALTAGGASIRTTGSTRPRRSRPMPAPPAGRPRRRRSLPWPRSRSSTRSGCRPCAPAP